MSGPNEKDPSAAAPESSDHKEKSSGFKVSEVASAVKIPDDEIVASATNSESDERARDNGKTGQPPEAAPQILKRVECKDGSVVLRFPVHGPACNSYHELAVFGGCDKPLVHALLRLWKRKLLPYYVLIVTLHPNPKWLQLACDAPCDETLAKFQAELDRIGWGLPWPVKATSLSSDSIELADTAGLGLRHQDDAAAGSAS